MPLNPNPELSSRERKMANKYNFEKQRTQISYLRQIYNDVGIFEMQRLLGMSHAIGNMSAVLNNSNPLVDLREHFDDFYHMRSAEWNGFYPTDMQVTADVVSDEFRSMVSQLFPSRESLAQKNKAIHRFEVDLSHLDLRQK